MPDAIDREAGIGVATGTSREPLMVQEDMSQVPRMPDGTMPSQMSTSGNLTQKQQPGQPDNSSFMPKPDTQNEDVQRKFNEMNRGFTQKMQEVADMRRQAEAERQMLQAMIAQQQQLASLQTPANAQNPPRGVIREVLGPRWDSMDPSAREVWGTIDQAFDVLQTRVQNQPQPPSTDPRVIGQLASEIIDIKTGQGLQQLSSMYGADVVNAYQDGIRNLCRQYPGVTAEQALDTLNPEIKRQYVFEQGKQAALEELKRQQTANVSDGRSFPSAQVHSIYRQGESMRESAARQGVAFND